MNVGTINFGNDFAGQNYYLSDSNSGPSNPFVTALYHPQLDRLPISQSLNRASNGLPPRYFPLLPYDGMWAFHHGDFGNTYQNLPKKVNVSAQVHPLPPITTNQVTRPSIPPILTNRVSKTSELFSQKSVNTAYTNNFSNNNTNNNNTELVSTTSSAFQNQNGKQTSESPQALAEALTEIQLDLIVLGNLTPSQAIQFLKRLLELPRSKTRYPLFSQSLQRIQKYTTEKPLLTPAEIASAVYSLKGKFNGPVIPEFLTLITTHLIQTEENFNSQQAGELIAGLSLLKNYSDQTYGPKELNGAKELNRFLREAAHKLQLEKCPMTPSSLAMAFSGLESCVTSDQVAELLLVLSKQLNYLTDQFLRNPKNASEFRMNSEQFRKLLGGFRSQSDGRKLYPLLNAIARHIKVVDDPELESISDVIIMIQKFTVSFATSNVWNAITNKIAANKLSMVALTKILGALSPSEHPIETKKVVNVIADKASLALNLRSGTP